MIFKIGKSFYDVTPKEEVWEEIRQSPKSIGIRRATSQEKNIVAAFAQALDPGADHKKYDKAKTAWVRKKKRIASQFKSIVDDLADSKITKNQFMNRAHKIFKDGYETAYRLGTDASGLDFFKLPSEDIRWLKRARSYEYKFLDNFADVLDKADGARPSFHGRAQMYADTMDSMFDAGRVDAYPNESTKIWWELNAAEHSLAKGTMIQTDEGVVRIGDEAIGSKVLTESGAKEFAGFVKQPDKKVTELETRMGYSIKASDLHKVMVVSTDGVLWKNVKDVNVGDYLVLKKGGLFPETDELSPDKAELFGIIDGDGYLHDKRTAVVVSPKDTDMIDRVVTLSKAVYNKDVKVRTGQRHSEICLYSKDVVNDTRNLKSNAIPARVLKSGEEVLCKYLKGLFSADGTVSKKGRPSLAQKSLNMVREVQFMLLRLGIVSTIKESWGGANLGEKKKYYKLNIVGRKSKELFRDKIGFIQSYKQERLKSEYVYDSVTMPIDIKKMFSYKKREIQRNGCWVNLYTKSSSFGYSTMQWFIENDWVNGDSEVLRLIENGCILDVVTNKHRKEVQETFDVAHSETGTVTGNGIVVHNCPDCIEMSMGSPYRPDTLPTTPGAGDTKCLSNCQCNLRIRYDRPSKIRIDVQKVSRKKARDLGLLSISTWDQLQKLFPDEPSARAVAEEQTELEHELKAVDWNVLDDWLTGLTELRMSDREQDLHERTHKKRHALEKFNEAANKFPEKVSPFSTQELVVLQKVGAIVLEMEVPDWDD